jgi:hypothetical protein
MVFRGGPKGIPAVQDGSEQPGLSEGLGFGDFALLSFCSSIIHI